MNRTRFEELKAIYGTNPKIVGECRGKVEKMEWSIGSRAVIPVVYIIWKHLVDENTPIDSLDEFFAYTQASSNRRAYIESSLGERGMMNVRFVERWFKKDELEAILLFYDNGTSRYYPKTSAPILRLSRALLRIEDGNEVGDFCTGSGSFILDCALDYENAKFCGIEIDRTLEEITSIRLELLGNCSAEFGDVLLLDDRRRYDRIFVHFPLGERSVTEDQYPSGSVAGDFVGLINSKRSSSSSGRPSRTPKNISADWFFSYAADACLKDRGRAVVLVTEGALVNGVDSLPRQVFLINKHVEAVIALPKKMLLSTFMSVAMVVFSKKENDSIMMVDAGRIVNNTSFDEDTIAAILDAVSEEKEGVSKRVPYSDFSDENTVLLPKRYLDVLAVGEGEAVRLCDVATIKRGTVTSANSDRRYSEEGIEPNGEAPRNEITYRVVTVANIRNGRVDNDLSTIGIDALLKDETDERTVKKGDLIMSKIGKPFRFAVAGDEVEQGPAVLASSNLYIITPKPGNDPYFLKAFFESEDGERTLDQISVGTAMQNIGARSLAVVKVPKETPEAQERFGLEYKKLLDKIDRTERELNAAATKLRGMYEYQKIKPRRPRKNF